MNKGFSLESAFESTFIPTAKNSLDVPTNDLLGTLYVFGRALVWLGSVATTNRDREPGFLFKADHRCGRVESSVHARRDDARIQR